MASANPGRRGPTKGTAGSVAGPSGRPTLGRPSSVRSASGRPLPAIRRPRRGGPGRAGARGARPGGWPRGRAHLFDRRRRRVPDHLGGERRGAGPPRLHRVGAQLAARAGIEVGDTILSVNGVPVDGFASLFRIYQQVRRSPALGTIPGGPRARRDPGHQELPVPVRASKMGDGQPVLFSAARALGLSRV